MKQTTSRQTKQAKKPTPRAKHTLLSRIDSEIEKAIVGQKRLIEDMVIGFLADGHILVNGVPGLAKTLSVKALAKIFDLSFNRIQFTPDLMPSDIIGYEVLEEIKQKKVFRFVQGPIFSQIILADEINRSPSKTQSALLQAMEEKEITVGGHKHKLQAPFMVLATQNPFEQEGTYALPEAQLDRFMFMLEIKYPTLEEEVMVASNEWESGVETIVPVISSKDLEQFKKPMRDVKVAPEVTQWLVKIIHKTRPNNTDDKMIKDYVRLGGSPRASKFAVKAAKAFAFLEGKTYVERTHLERVLFPVLRHRILLNYNAEVDNVSTDDIISHLLKTPL